MRKTIISCCFMALQVCVACSDSGSSSKGGQAGAAGAGGDETATHWVGTWATGPQLTEPNNMPPEPGLADNTLRQVLRVSMGGEELRMEFSNEFGNGPVTMNAVHLANSAGEDAIEPDSDTQLTFDGEPSITIPQGDVVVSDSVEFALEPLSNIAVTVHFGEVPSGVTGHPGSRTTSYLVAGDAVDEDSFDAPVETEHWYYMTALDVMVPTTSKAVVVLGDSLTDGRGTTTDRNQRWTDVLAERLQANAATEDVGVLNLGIGGNAVLSGGLGPTARQRFERDVLGQSGARWLIVLEGVNDIGYGNANTVAADLIEAYEQFIEDAHAEDMLVYGVPILPFGNSQYDTPEHEEARLAVNEWIRTSGAFDAVIDLDEAVRDPEQPERLAPQYTSTDRLHLSPAGYAAMAEAVDLSLFEE